VIVDAAAGAGREDDRDDEERTIVCGVEEMAAGTSSQRCMYGVIARISSVSSAI
jgi:hypothetical protein